MLVLFFFFSSIRRHTRSLRDWSSDVCSSDLRSAGAGTSSRSGLTSANVRRRRRWLRRSEERRVGKESRSRWSPYHLKKKKEWRLVGLVRKHIDRTMGTATEILGVA